MISFWQTTMAAGNGAGYRTLPDKRDLHSMTTNPSSTPIAGNDQIAVVGEGTYIQ